MNKILKVTLLIILAAGLLVAGCSGCAEQVARVGSQAPDFQFQGLDGQSTSLSDLRGKTVLINFWTTKCPSCVYQMPFLQGIFEDEEWSNKGLVILAINIGENPSTVKSFMESYGYSFPVLLDTRGDVALKYGIRHIPVSLFIDKNGIIKAVKVGPFSSKAAIAKSLGQIIP